MPRRSILRSVIGIVALWSCATTAAERVLLRLESSAEAPVLKQNIAERAGLQRATSVAARATWKLVPGDTVSGARQPNERLIELYTGTAQSPVLLCYVLLRYYRAGAGWVPHLQIQQDPMVALVNGEWKPIELAPGLAAALVQHGSTLPNPEGFFPRLEIGSRTGALPIIGWNVRAP